MAKTQIRNTDVRDATLTDADFAAANIDGVQSVASLRTLSASAPADLGVAAAGAGQTASPATHIHAAHVSKTDAVSAAADYLARLKLAADTTYRASLGLDASDRGALELGPGGTTARDVRMYRRSDGVLVFDAAASDGSEIPVLLGYFNELIFIGSGAGFGMTLQKSDESIGRFTLRADANEQSFKFGTGAAWDTRLNRSAAKKLTLDDGAGGAITVEIVGKRQTTPSASQTLAAGTALLANAEFLMFTCTGAITTTAAPTIADGVDGQVITLVNVGTGTWTIKDQGTLASSNLRLTAATIAIGPRQSIEMIYSATVGDWVQTGTLVAVI